MMTELFDVRTWYNEAVDAVLHFDAAPAYHLLRALDKNRDQFEIHYEKNELLKNEVESLKRKLFFVAFPEVSVAEAEKVLTSEVIPFLQSGVDLDDRFSVRSVFTAYGEHENERKILKEALLKNREKIGSMGIGEWLQAFDRMYTPLTRNENAVLDFLTREQKVAALQKSEYEMLRIILFVYEKWLATGRLSIYDVAFMNRAGGKFEVGMKIDPAISGTFATKNVSMTSRQKESAAISLPLLQALSKYEQLGNQLITSERIKVKSQTEPVRPSLLYWLKYYRDELGIGHHDSVQRGQFLFRSENGKKLSSEERERVSLILKSVEEDLPLQIDIVRNEIVFPHFEVSIERPPQSVIPPVAPPLVFEPKKIVEVPRPEPVFQVEKPIRFDEKKEDVTSQKGTLSFTSSHVFPAEKEKIEIEKRTPVEQSNPFHIRPVSMAKKQDDEE